ncbi:response regulator [Nocardioides rubriscoriae]|uniref:response regulator n=1 Tax=Nocardioides rubriscoriae TaxID=642762 RepID=UPI0011E01DF5|nr:response regulator transcription factor [Nocardioides rubriscoriae]
MKQTLPAAEIGVVVIDDRAEIRELIEAQLAQSTRVRVIGAAGDGRSGIETVRQLQPDVVLLDLGMPTMDGLEALPLLRSAAPDAKIIVLSGFQELSQAQQALDAGAHLYLEKTLSLQLADVIEEAVDGD